MTFFNTIKATIGPDRYARIEQEAEHEVALAFQMPLKNKYNMEQYYSPRLLLREFEGASERLDKAGVPVLPLDILLVLFRCRLLHAAKSEQEFLQRGGRVLFFDNRATFPSWADKATAVPTLDDQYVSGLQTVIGERTLLSHISSLNPGRPDYRQQQFFDDLFSALALPLVSFLDDDLIEKHKQRERGLRNYDQAGANAFFSAPSLGFTAVGTENHCFWHGAIWLRTFLNMLRIAAFIYPGQRESVLNARMEPPTFPVFLGRHAQGSYQWNEDEKESWKKLPGYRLLEATRRSHASPLPRVVERSQHGCAE